MNEQLQKAAQVEHLCSPRTGTDCLLGLELLFLGSALCNFVKLVLNTKNGKWTQASCFDFFVMDCPLSAFPTTVCFIHPHCHSLHALSTSLFIPPYPFVFLSPLSPSHSHPFPPLLSPSLSLSISSSLSLPSLPLILILSLPFSPLLSPSRSHPHSLSPSLILILILSPSLPLDLILPPLLPSHTLPFSTCARCKPHVTQGMARD